MPLFLCPNDSAQMQTVNRNGVEFDICPTCKGVWLDRGELEKLMTSRSAEREAQESGYRALEKEAEDFHRDPEDWRRRHPYDPATKRYRYDDGHARYYKYKKRKGFDLFDIFD